MVRANHGHVPRATAGEPYDRHRRADRGAGPAGPTAALDRRGRGSAAGWSTGCLARLPYAEAVGSRPWTFEPGDRMGVARAALDAAPPTRGRPPADLT
ncbi:hypothetical protein ACIHEJ_00385 [Streptomyces sp. NPDC052301]|uniref:hypothetical protein n=1 Tax=Streptomyces sp. NPDC052301 TaxID=3365687 RepID=UPI0037D1BF1B